jgi:hypothetical protein
VTVSSARARSISGRASRASSALMNAMSKSALCAIKGASPMKARNSSATAANFGLSARKASLSPWMRNDSSSTARSGLT